MDKDKKVQKEDPNKLYALLDDSKMQFGKAHQGKMMRDVPASYLLWMWDDTDLKERTRIGNYVANNIDELRAEAAKEKQTKKL